MTTHDPEAGQPKRKVGIPLGVGIVFLPFIFAWFTLRKGYSTAARAVSLVWMAVFVIGAIAGGGSPTAGSEGAAPPAPAVKTEAELAAERQAELRRQYERDPARALTLEASGQKGGFDTVLLISGTLSNAANFAIKDVRIECELFGNSGTRIGRVTQTLFEIVPAEGTKRFSELNMGFMGGAGQVSTYQCRPIRAAKVTP